MASGCQCCIKASIYILLILCALSIFTSVLKYIYATNIGKTDVFKAVAHAVIESEDFEHVRVQLQMVGFGLAGLTFLGIICACFSLCFANYFKGPCNIFLTRCMVCLSVITYLSIAILWSSAGSALVLPSQLGGKFIDDNCERALQEQSSANGGGSGGGGSSSSIDNN